MDKVYKGMLERKSPYLVPGDKLGSYNFHLNGFYYTYKDRSKDGNRISLRCKHSGKLIKCQAGAVYTVSEDILVLRDNGKTHICGDPDTIQASIQELKKEIKEEAKLLPVQSLSEAFDKKVQAFCQLGNAHKKAAERNLSYAHMESTLRKIQAKTVPNIPDTLPELGRLLNNELSAYSKCHSNAEEDFYKGYVEEDETCILLFVLPNAKNVFKNKKHFSADGTFSSRPRKPETRQLFGIYYTRMGHTFPVAFALMTHKTKRAYILLLRMLKRMYPEWNPVLIILDYELALHLAFQEVFPGIIIVGCWFHYAQAIWRAVQKLGLVPKMIDSPDCSAWKVVSMLIALPLLEADDIAPTYEEIKEFAEDEEIENVLEPLFKYYEKFWLPKASCISVHGHPHRTNNGAERFHLFLNRKMGSRPNIWKFLALLREVEWKVMMNFELLENGNRISRLAALPLRLQNKAIHDYTKKLDSQLITPFEFVQFARHRVGHKLYFKSFDEYPEDDEQDPPVVNDDSSSDDDDSDTDASEISPPDVAENQFIENNYNEEDDERENEPFFEEQSAFIPDCFECGMSPSELVCKPCDHICYCQTCADFKKYEFSLSTQPTEIPIFENSEVKCMVCDKKVIKFSSIYDLSN